MKSQKKIKARKTPRKTSKKSRSRRKVKSDASSIPLIRHREVEEQFIADHPEAFDPFIGEWVVLEGASIISHGMNAAIVADEARARGVKVPYMFRVEPKLKPNEGYLGL